jgi:hypothetical protein
VTEAQVQTLAMTATPAQAQAQAMFVAQAQAQALKATKVYGWKLVCIVRIVKSEMVDVFDVSVLSVMFWVRMLRLVMGSWVEH